MIQTGLDILVHERQDLLRGQRVGLVTHPAAVLPDCSSALDALLAAGVQITALFGMEHGYNAAAADGAAVDHAVDASTGLPVYSLYGAQREPAAGMLAAVDVLLCDVQDVGARFYTFISTLYYVLRAAGQHGRPVIMLDRPNPINGRQVEGGAVEADCLSFVGILPLPIRHGLTYGELARYMNVEHGLDAELVVVAMRGWQRGQWFDETGLPWVPTSPAMPHLSTATVYPGACLLEGTNVSEGRGTPLPFEILGAPWIDGDRLAAELNGRALPGVRFRPTAFEPCAGKHAGQLCRGVQVHVLDRETFQPVRCGLELVAACQTLAPEHFTFLPTSWEGSPPHFDLLAGSAAVRTGLAAGRPIPEITAGWPGYAAEVQERSRPYLLYEPGT